MISGKPLSQHSRDHNDGTAPFICEVEKLENDQNPGPLGSSLCVPAYLCVITQGRGINHALCYVKGWNWDTDDASQAFEATVVGEHH